MDIPVKDLSESFPTTQIKQRKGNFGNTLDYVESITVIQRLNEVLEGCWSFQILDFKIQPDETKVEWDFTLGNLTLGSVIHSAIESFYRQFADTGTKMSLDDILMKYEDFWGIAYKDKTFESDCNAVILKETGRGL
jgi:hypothetical protein